MRLLKSGILSVALLSLTAINTQAQDTLHRAVVFKLDNGCEWFEVETGFLIGETVHAVGQYAGGPFPQRGKATCRGSHDLELDSPVITKGGLCAFGPFWTVDSIFVATPGGEWMVQCQFPDAD